MRRPLLRESDLELERNVILEEISSVEDTPDDLVFELHARALWPEHPYGYSILGTPGDGRRADAPTTSGACTDSAYYPANCVIAAAGNIEHDQLLTVLEREGWFAGQTRAGARGGDRRPAQRGVDAHRRARDTAQTHIVFGTDTFRSATRGASRSPSW